MESLTEPPILSHTLQPYEAPSGERALNHRLDATGNDEGSPNPAGAMSAGEKSIKQALEAVEENGTEREGRICLTRQILLPPAAQNHQDFGPTAASTSMFPVFSLTDS